jgi:1-aminocyclopropane-1-carboxylate deaminase
MVVLVGPRACSTVVPVVVRASGAGFRPSAATYGGANTGCCKRERIVALSDFPRYPLLFGPSPVHPLDRMSDHLGGARIWAKREDCNSGLAFGGNKTRKLEYLVPDALAQRATHLVSIGGVQSNHTRQVAAVAAKLGLKARLVQESWVDWPDAVNDRVGNILLSRIMGAEVELVEAGFGIGFKESWERALDQIRADGGIPYPIPAGASDHRLGGLGFANWAYELQQQEQELGVFFDTIIVCTVTGSTHAGMIAGFAGQDRSRRVLGIDASAKIDETRTQVEKIARNTAELIGLGRDLRDDEISVLEGWAGDYYGIPVRSTLDAIRLTGRLEGVILDPVYEGKSMAALIDLVRTGEIGADSTVLYAHLGGQPALNAYSALFRN